MRRDHPESQLTGAYGGFGILDNSRACGGATVHHCKPSQKDRAARARLLGGEGGI